MINKREDVKLMRSNASHVERVLADISPISKRDVDNAISCGYDFVKDALKMGRCVTILINNIPAAIIKIPNISNVNDFVWVIFTNRVMKLHRQLHRETIRILRLWLEKYSAIRTTCLKDNLISFRWLKRLGFVEIGFVPCGDYLMEMT